MADTTVLDPQPAGNLTPELTEAAPVSTPAPTNGTAIEKAFTDFFSAETKSDPGWDKFKGKTGDDLFKSYKNLESALGSRIKLPDENSTLEDRKAFWEKLGKPHAATEYPVELDPFFGADESSIQEFQRVFYESNLTKEQASGILHALNTSAQANNQATAAMQDQARVESETSLRRTWGANFDMNRALAKRAVTTVFGDEHAERIVAANGNDAQFIQGMQKVGAMLNEKGLLGKSSPRELGGYAPEEAANLYKDVIRNPDNAEFKAYHDKKHPQHQAVQDKVLGLIRASQQS